LLKAKKIWRRRHGTISIYNFNLVSFFVNRFWGRRPDGVANNEDLPQQIVNILEFKQSTDREKGLFEMKEAEANEQHKDVISAF